MNYRENILNLIIGAVLMNLMIFVSQIIASVNGEIAFVSNGDIFTMNADGSGRTKLTNSGSANFPKFSPAGRKIAFYQSGAIYLMEADGGNQIVLTSTVNNIGLGTLAWSPDGQRIAFTCNGICIVNADDSNPITISNNPDDHSPDWSPNGSKIAFTRKGPLENADIFVMDINGNNQTRLTANEIPDYKPVWSPDGTKIVFTRLDDCLFLSNGEILCFSSSILTMNADGSNQTFIIGASVFDDDFVDNPGWSPDGTKIVFSGDQFYFSQVDSEIFVINANGSNRINLSNTANISEYSPDWGTAPPSVPNRTAFDFDGDGRADVAVFRPSDSVWYLNQSTAGFSATQFGISTDKITPADYDGDGKTDIAVFRNGTWYLQLSQSGFIAVQFGQAGDVPVPADYTGDGRAELAVYRNGTWHTLNLVNNQLNTVQFGIASDKAVPADYDGDGRTDYAVYRDGVWHLLRSTQGYTAIQFGIASDKPVASDYDGDGKADAAVYRDGIWYLLQSSQGFTAFQFGIATDILAPGDFDGDGKSDIAVFRPGNGVWYVWQSSNGNVSSQQFGLNGDTPMPSAFIPQ